MRYRECFLAGVLVVGVLAATTSPALASTLIPIDVPGGTETQAYGINDRGQIVGNYVAGGAFHGFLLANGIFTAIDVPGATTGTQAREINNRGQIVGVYFTGAGRPVSHGFLLEKGIFTTIDVPGARDTRALGINDRGQIVGDYVAGASLGFLLDQGIFTTIDVPGARVTEAFGINNRGQIVGVYNAGEALHGFLLDQGMFTTIDVPGARVTDAFGINDHGQIVGTYVLAGTAALHGFLKDAEDAGEHIDGNVDDVHEDGDDVSDGHRNVQLDHGIFTTIDVPGASETDLFGINNRGQMVGVYVAAGTSAFHGFVLF